jgi:hypothetical protein
MNLQQRNLLLFFLYFFLSAVLTWGFVIVSPVYISDEQLWLSSGIAGGKWLIQILLAVFLLKDKTLKFLRNIGFVCFVGSCLLVPYIVLSMLGIADDAGFFAGSLTVCVAMMIALYFRAVRKTGISVYWFLFWLLCLATAVTLQLTVVFHVL